METSEDVKQWIEQWIQSDAEKSAYLNKYATYIERTTNPPFLFVETKRETYGKRKGWNPCINSKNQIYYSGWAFVDAETLLEYKKLK